MRQIKVSALCIIIGLFAGCSLPNANTIIDADDVTPSIVTTAPLTALWYGPLSITRYDSQTGLAAAPVTDAFYLDLKLRTDNSIIGTYTTCPIATPISRADIATYDIATGTFEPQRQLVYLIMFSNTYSNFSGDTISLNGQKWSVHGDNLLAKYSSVLHKIARTSFLTACDMQATSPTTTP